MSNSFWHVENNINIFSLGKINGQVQMSHDPGLFPYRED